MPVDRFDDKMFTYMEGRDEAHACTDEKFLCEECRHKLPDVETFDMKDGTTMDLCNECYELLRELDKVVEYDELGNVIPY